jgi:hypothetical protein
MIHTACGSKHNFVFIIGGLGLFMAVGAVVAIKYPYLWTLVNPASFTLYYLLAAKYSRTAHEIPYLLRGKRPEQPKFCLNKATQGVMLALNIILPVLDGYYYGKVHDIDNPPAKSAYILYIIFIFTDCVLLLISGTMLICAVAKIRAQTKKYDWDVKVRQLLIHAVAFSLYIVAFIGYGVVVLYQCFDPQRCAREMPDKNVYSLTCAILDIANLTA